LRRSLWSGDGGRASGSIIGYGCRRKPLGALAAVPGWRLGGAHWERGESQEATLVADPSRCLRGRCCRVCRAVEAEGTGDAGGLLHVRRWPPLHCAAGRLVLVLLLVQRPGAALSTRQLGVGPG